MSQSAQEILDELFLRDGPIRSIGVLWETNAEFRSACRDANDETVRKAREYLEREERLGRTVRRGKR